MLHLRWFERDTLELIVTLILVDCDRASWDWGWHVCTFASAQLATGECLSSDVSLAFLYNLDIFLLSFSLLREILTAFYFMGTRFIFIAFIVDSCSDVFLDRTLVILVPISATLPWWPSWLTAFSMATCTAWWLLSCAWRTATMT